MTQLYHGPPTTQQLAAHTGWCPRLRRFRALLLALGLATAAHGQQRPAQNFFQADAAARTAADASPLATALTRPQALTLDAAGLRTALATAPPESRAGAAPLLLALPRPDGTLVRFALREAPVMAPALAARYPMIKTYAGIGLDDATATVRLDLTPRGFHAQVLAGSGQSFFIDPVNQTDGQHYLSFYRKDMNRAAAGQAMACGFAPTAAEVKASAARVAASTSGARTALSSGAQLRTFRLALSCTPEYALTKGNTAMGVLAGEVTTVNRVVGVYEKELAVRLVLVANNDQLIFLNGTGPQPSPAFSNGDGNQLLGQNQQNVDRIIGTANYDIGHVVSTGGGGVAGLGVVCNPTSKAMGVTGLPNPVGDAFDIDYVAHEMGHQFSGNHPFNGCGGNFRRSNTAWEPGSGSTIMAYAGICGAADDLQPHSDATFHTGNYEEMRAFISSTACGVNTPTGNTAPTVTAPASGKTLPANTPFKLTATATDADNDPLTYSWEELDLGPTGSPTAAQVAGQDAPLFRSFNPTLSGTRYFPRLSSLVANTTVIGERLPTVNRVLRFRCTARDEHSGPAGVIGGVDFSSLVTLNVSSTAGPFVVRAPNTAVSWIGGAAQTVSWDVAGTTNAPISCALVNLRLSLDGGLSYPLTLATGVANSGSASITVPNAPTAAARLMVEAADNYFFDISDADFAITPGPGPVITSFTPAFGPVGTVVTLTGSGFTGATAVRFNGTAATNVTGTATSLTATVAAGSTSGLITVTTPLGTVSSATPFRVGAPPTITGFTPTSGPTGTVVTLTGTNLLGAIQVTLNGADVPTPSVNSATQLTLTLPDGATTGRFAVTTPFGTATSAGVFTVPLRPVITAFTPTRGPVSTTVVVLTGRNFTGATQVRFGGVAATPAPGGSDTQLTVTVPIGALTGPLAVTTPQGTGVSGGSFTVLPTPALTAISPASGPAGITVTGTGTGLDQVTTLTLNGASLAIRTQDATSITFVVPAGATTGAVLGTATGGGGTSSVRFTVLVPAPGVVISGLVPAQGPTRASIRLIGTGFSGTTLVTFPGSSANTVSSGFTVNAAGTELSGLVVPDGAVTGPLTVTTPAGTSAASAPVFTVCALPGAQAQNARLVLGPGATTTLAPTAVNSGSTANCGAATAATLSVVPNAFTTADIGPAVVASALRLNGNGQYVAIGSSATVPSGNSPYTIEAWMKPTTMGGNSIIGWGAFGSYNSCNALRLSPTGLVNYWWGNDLEMPTASLAGAWHHVAATFDGTTRTLYLDGKAIGTDQPGGGHNVPNAQNLRIGSTNSGEFFNGSLDEVRVWNVARTAAQLNATKGAHLLRNPAGLVAYYRFGEGSGTATADANGVVANAGTLTGGAGWTTDAPAIVNGVPVALTVTDAGSHTATALTVVTVVAGTATATANATATACSIWPNPVGAKGALHVRLAMPAATASLTLRNGLGQLVRTRTFGGSATELPTAGLASGLYLLRVQADGHAPAVRRVVVE